jgi:hypothetical protein
VDVPAISSVVSSETEGYYDLDMYQFDGEVFELKTSSAASEIEVATIESNSTTADSDSLTTEGDLATTSQTLQPQDSKPTAVENSKPGVEQDIHPFKVSKALPEFQQDAIRELEYLLYVYRATPPKQVPIDHLFKLYNSLPSTRICFLQRRSVTRFLAILSRQNWLHISAGQNFEQIVNDLRENHSSLRLREWVTYLDLIGKGRHIPQKMRLTKIRQALVAMQDSGVKVNEAVLSTLLQSTSKANDLELWNIVNQAIDKRTSQPNIIIWTERIKFAGKAKDVEQIHSTYRRFLETGTPIDIPLLNALFGALINAGQAGVAETIFLRLRKVGMDAIQQGRIPSRGLITLRQQRSAKLALYMEDLKPLNLGELFAQDAAPVDSLQSIRKKVYYGELPHSVPTLLIPNHGTLRIFLSYHCHRTGNVHDIAFYLNEMRQFSIGFNYGNFVDLLHAFYLWHDTNPLWTQGRLQAIFSIIGEDVAAQRAPVFPIKYVVALAAIRAFGTVFDGNKAREVWELLRPWMVLNENVSKYKDQRVDNLEAMVRTFEGGKKLDWRMAGGYRQYRIVETPLEYV